MQIYLKYSPLISIPVLGYLLLVFQALFIVFGLQKVLYLSNREKKLLPHIVAYISSKTEVVVCTTTQIGHVVRFFTNTVIVDLPPEDMLTSDSKSYSDLMWVLTLSAGVTRQTALELKKIYGYRISSVIPVLV